MAVVVAGAPEVGRAADYDIGVVKTGPDSVDLSWKAERGNQYLVCWKLDSLGGDVCGNGGYQATGNIYGPTDTSFVNGRKTMRLYSLTKCNVEYKVRVRRTLVAFDTFVFWFPC